MSLARPAAVQIWTMGTGGGHRSVARALAGALEAEAGRLLAVSVDDPTELGIGATARRLSHAYGPLIRSWPQLWGLLFQGFSGPGARRSLDRFLRAQLGPAMTASTRARAPQVVVSCHPLLTLPAWHAAQACPQPPALVTLMTDLGGGHEHWVRPVPHLLLAATPEAVSWCRGHGLPESRLRLTGLPVDPALAAVPGASRQHRRQSLGLAPDPICVLVSGGAEGAGQIWRWTRWLQAIRPPLQVVVACGRNRRLAARLHRSAAPGRVRVLGHQDCLTPWLQAADVYLGKAGPSSLAEAAAAGLAILLAGALPGQEAANDRILVRAGAGRRISGRRELEAVLARLRQPGDPLLGELRTGAIAWSRPQAAAAAARAVLELL
ncbi:MAG: MGDG synthase family glycosyltransferase [Candidatus Dormibacteria bacterium]